MVFNSAAVVAIADVSTDTWQLIWRIPTSQRINTQQLVDMAFCYPVYQLSRFVLCLWTFMCLPPNDSFYSYTYESQYASSSSSSDDDADDEDRLAFEHNLCTHRGYYSDSEDDRSSSSSSFEDYYNHYSHSD